MNKVILMGRLTRDPEIRYANSNDRNMTVARYTLAVNRRTTKTETAADFIQCVAFDKAGEFAERYFKKGMQVLITGRLQTGSYVNKDGQKVYTTDVIIEAQEFADTKRNDYDTDFKPMPENAQLNGFDITGDVDDMEIPFD